jgi:hypothetical protein
MKFNQLNGFVFDSESGVLGAVAGVDFIKQTITILTDEDTQIVAQLANVEFLEELGAIGGVGIINRDVVETADGKLYEIVKVSEKTVQLYLLNNKLERVEAGDEIEKVDLHVLAPYVTVLGNIHELEPQEVVDFNIKVVRKQFEDEIVFFYACNNVDAEEVDLIKVVFVGHHLLKEENYMRITLSHDEYLEQIENGSLKETDPSALITYMNGLMSFNQPEPVQDDEDFEEDFEEEENFEEEICEECGEHNEYCVCEDEEDVDYDF